MKLLILRRAFAAPLLVAPLVVALAAAPTRAQEPRRLNQPDSIPLDLATALIASGGLGGEPQILVGGVPGWMTPKIFVPANGRILGAAYIGTTGLAIISTPDMPDVAMASMRRELESRGWKNPPAQPSFGGGFRPATMNMNGGDGTRITVCNEPQLLTAYAVRRRGTSTDIVTRITTVAPGQSQCSPRDLPPGFRPPPWPTLYNPVGVMEGNQICGGDNPYGSQGTGALLRTPMNAASLLDHYAKQLSDSGWRTPTDNASIIGRTWTRPDSTGAPVELTITVATSLRDPSCRTLNMVVHTLKKP